MKKKILKIASLITVITIATMGVLSVDKKKVAADESNCTEKTAYMYFTDIAGTAWIGSASAADKKRTYTTNVAIDFSNWGIAENSIVTLTDNQIDTSIFSVLDDFWKILVGFDGLNDVKMDGDIMHVMHGKWNVNAGTYTDQQTSLSGCGTTPSICSNATIPSTSFTTFGTVDVGGEDVTGTIQKDTSYVYTSSNKSIPYTIVTTRDYGSISSADNYGGVTANVNEGGVAATVGNGSVLAPARIKLIFNVCEPTSSTPTENKTDDTPVVNDDTTHTLTVRYWLDEVGGKEASPTVYETHSTGDNYSVTSPKLDNLTADRDVVAGTMPNKDVVEDVIYKGKYGEVATGIIWLLGVAGLGYGAYYFSRVEKENAKVNKEK